MTWETVYNFFGVKDFIYFISSSQIQEVLFPVKIVFIFCSIFFFIFVVYFMINSSWLQYKFLEDVTEFFSWQAYGTREMSKQWNKIKKRTETGAEPDYKLAIIDADDFLLQVLADRGYDEDTFEQSVEKADKLIPSLVKGVLAAHQIRNSIVFDPNFSLPVSEAKKVLDIYEQAVKGVGIG